MLLFACMNFSIGWEGLLILGGCALLALVGPFVACALAALALKGLFVALVLLFRWVKDRVAGLGKDQRLAEYEAQYAAWEAERARLAKAWERERGGPLPT